MTRSHLVSLLRSLACALFAPMAHAEIAPDELVAPKMEISNGNLHFTVQPSLAGRNYQLQVSDTMAAGTWTNVGVVRSGDGGNVVISTPYESAVQRRFFRVAIVEAAPAPEGFSLISAGEFLMGNALLASWDGSSDEWPVHPVNVSAFHMGKYEVTWLEWRTVRDWAVTQGYTDLSGRGSGKADTHPVHSITWWEMVKWCNARTEYENATKGTSLTPCYYTDTAQTVVFRTGTNSPNGIDNARVKWTTNGYRLPTEAEWEKAARGGLSGKRFPWGNTISHSQANYRVYSSDGTTNYYSYDVTPRPPGMVYDYYHPSYNDGVFPYTSPVGSFASNGYGLYDMAGNLWEWCWDWYGSYTAGSQTDPRGAPSGSDRVGRGGYWYNKASLCRVAYRFNGIPTNGYGSAVGFRLARSSVP